MLLALVLAACFAPAAHEWVEISQTHYRKPTRTHQDSTIKKNPAQEEPIGEIMRPAFFPAHEKTSTEKVQYGFSIGEKTETASDKVRHSFLAREKMSKTNVQQAFFPVHEETTSKSVRHSFPADKKSSDKNVQHTIPAHKETTTGIRHSSRPIAPKPSFFNKEKDENKNDYRNQTITEYNWNQHEYGGGDIKRYHGNMKLKANITPEFSLDVFGEVTEREPESTTRLKNKEVLSATIERVPNKGSIKRVQLSNTPVKSPSLPNSVVSNIQKTNNRRHGVSGLDSDLSDEFDIKHDIFADVQSGLMSSTKQIKQVLSSTKETPLWKYTKKDTSTVWPITITEPGERITKHPQSTSESKLVPNNNIKDNVNISKLRDDYPVTVSNHYRPHEEFKQENKNRIKDPPNFISKNNKNNIPEEIHPEEDKNNVDSNNIINNSHDVNNPSSKIHKAKPTNSENEKVKVVHTMENVMKVLKVVTETISSSSRRGFNGKVKYLQELKETLLRSIGK